MSESDQPSTSDRLTDLLDEGDNEKMVAYLDRLGTVDADTRKRALRAVRNGAEDRPTAFEGLATPLAAFLTDDNRAVRLTTAKLFVTLGQSKPETVLPVVDTLADRLADEKEFYYVRARCAEALGYVALDHPEAVSDPEIMADFRIGLSFDEPEVKEKLAKALEFVALGDPWRLRHQVDSLAEHLDDENELVRYHLTTTLVALGCEHPEKLTDAGDALTARLDDEEDNLYTRGRAAEALGLLARAESDASSVDGVPEEDDEEESFLAERVRFARQALAGREPDETIPDEVGTVEAVRETTKEAVAEITAPDGEGECPHCGLVLPENGPPMCPRCGAPY